MYSLIVLSVSHITKLLIQILLFTPKYYFIFTALEQNNCGGYLTDTAGWLSSVDLDNDGKYDRNLDCLWTIVAKEGHKIFLRILLLDIDCDNDYLSVGV